MIRKPAQGNQAGLCQILNSKLEYLDISLHFSSFLYVNLHFSVFLWIALNFSTFLCISLHYRRPMDAIFHVDSVLCSTVIQKSLQNGELSEYIIYGTIIQVDWIICCHSNPRKQVRHVYVSPGWKFSHFCFFLLLLQTISQESTGLVSHRSGFEVSHE